MEEAMARIAMIGASIGELPASYEARALFEKKHKVTVTSNVESFHFVPSNPWVAVGWCAERAASFSNNRHPEGQTSD
jgi:sulfide:quinone oxidoreductase